jgi:hypothetical protein
MAACRSSAASDRVPLGRPEAGAVGRENLIDEEQPAVARSELELAIGNDDAARRRQRPSAFVHVPCQALEPASRLIADDLRHAGHRNVLVMAGLRLRCGTEERRLEAIALAKSRRQNLSGKGARLAILLPCRASEIATDHALDGEDARSPTEHRPSAEKVAMAVERRDLVSDLIRVGAQHMMLHVALESAQPPCGELRQDGTLRWNGLVHHHVEGTDAIGGDEQQAPIVDHIHVPNLPAPLEREREIRRRDGSHTRTSSRAGSGGAPARSGAMTSARNSSTCSGARPT